ncbi:MAG: pseudouridine synthase [Pseudomonadota bacterium]
MLPSGAPYAPPQAPLSLIHVDPALVLVDKPAGLLTVPGKAPGLGDCLEARVRAAFPEALLIHRLDMDTSGIMVFARTRVAQRHLNWQFERRQTTKIYAAHVWGVPDAAAGQIDLPLITDWPNRPLQKVCPTHGRAATTHWQRLGAAPAGARLRLTPVTGRSHQLRVHLNAIGHPILGDRFYATGPALTAAPRLMLHAETLGFRHPEGGAPVRWTVPAPF